MNKQLAMTVIGATIETLAEVPEGTGPEGHLYMAMQHFGIDLDGYQTLVGIMVESGLVTRVAGPQLRITTKGRALAAKMTQIRAEGAAKPAQV